MLIELHIWGAYIQGEVGGGLIYEGGEVTGITVFKNGYQYQFDVESLFTNVPLNKTIIIILDRNYRQKLLKINLKKRTMKKILLDSVLKPHFPMIM